MSIPNFNIRGVLPTGIHEATPQEFVDRFCADELGEYRLNYAPIIDDLLGFCHERGAISILFTGSFITSETNPSDLDCIVVFKNENNIPTSNESFIAEHGRIDMTYCSVQNESVLKNLLRLYTIDKHDIEVGIVNVNLENPHKYSWPCYEESSLEELMIYRQAYHQRHMISTNQKKGVIIALHGILSDAEWLLKLAPIASSDNWIYAPFFYGKKYPNILVSKSEKMALLEEFREFINKIYDKYQMEPNIIAHSFGTYIIGNYLKAFNCEPPVSLKNIIFSGSILAKDFPWDKCIKNNAVRTIYNEVSANDKWVPHIEKTSWLVSDELFGLAGTEGFTCNHDRVMNNHSLAFNHNNMLNEDIFEKIWLPHLNITKNINKFNNIKYLN